MRIATVILIIFLIIASAMAGLGYLFQFSSTLRAQNAQLNQDIQTLQTRLANEQAKNQQLQVSFATLNTEFEKTRTLLNNEKSANIQLAGEKRLCEMQTTLGNLSGNVSTSAVMIPTTLGTILGAIGVERLIRRSRTIRIRPGSHMVSMQVPYDQLQEYINFRRQRGTQP